jgi:hypothetical protein
MNEINSPLPATRRHPGSIFLFGCLGLFGLVAVLTIATLLFGLHTGEEFAPDSFQRRTFYYYQIPLLGIQVTPIVREDQTSMFERYLRTNGFIAPGKPPTGRWDLVRATQGGKVRFRGDAEILCSYLDAVDPNDTPYWKAWSEKNADAAKVLWPLVARMARRQLYILVPEMIDLARGESNPARLRGRLEDSLAHQFLRLGQTEQALGNHEQAIELLDEALRYAPDDPEILTCRELSRQQLGQAGE